jgi:hypothetical protein
MQVVILAGGKGTRLSEETKRVPKPMVNIGEFPIIWHIMNHYANFGHKDFIIALGYKGYVLKEYFANYKSHNADFSVDLSDGSISTHSFPIFDQASESPGLIKEICTARRENRTPLIRSLNSKHDFVHVKDVSQALIIIIRNRENGLFEIGCGKTHSVREVAEALGFSFNAVEEKTDSNLSSINITRLTQIGYVATYTNEFFHD